MACPACGHLLTQVHLANVTLDACRGGCEGIWFDYAELNRFDEKHELVPTQLLVATPAGHAEVDHSMRRNCPRCLDTVMRRGPFTPTGTVEVDHCPQCGGYWLDAQELKRIREEFPTAAARDQARREFLENASRVEHRRDGTPAPAHADRARTIDSLLRIVGSRYVHVPTVD